MTLMAGRSLGPYQILAPIGAGGMGEVYRAHDARLGREVAVKVLPASVCENPDRLRRFEQEARSAGGLNHPNVLAVYDVGTGDGAHYVVSELLEGETLGTKVAESPLPLRKCLDYGIQVARGLAAAHAKGIVHRDLKPENLFVTHDGRVKILDFGLAKLSRPESEPSSSEGATPSESPQTTPGALLGTVGYMAPEQISGRATDHRSDIFSFGAVFFEMLFGRRAFRGQTAAETMFAILKQDPLEPSETARLLPPGVERILRHCLEKSPDERFQSARDLAFHLEAISGPADAPTPVTQPTGRSRIALWTLSGLLAGGLIVWAGVRFLTTTAPAVVTRFTITPPLHVALGDSMALSPDGRTLVYSGHDDTGNRLYRRNLATLESVPIRGTEDAAFPFFSPDGGSLGFSVGRALKRVPLQGGTATTVFEAASRVRGGTWLADDTIVFAFGPGRLMRVPASGGEAREVTAVDGRRGEVGLWAPDVLPGDRGVLFTVHLGARDSQRVDVLSLDSGKRTALVQGNGAHFLPTGHIVFQRNGSLWVAPLDQTRLTLTGPPTAVVEGVAIGVGWRPIVAVARNGSLAYAIGREEPFPPRILVWVDKRGREKRIDAPARAWWWPHISPDGRRLGFHIMDPLNMDAWIYELDHGPLIRMTYAPQQDGYPLWTPDGKRIVFWSRQAGESGNLYMRSADLTGTDERLTESPNYQVPVSWAGDGKMLVFQEGSPDTGSDIGVVPIEGEHTPHLLINGRADEGGAAVSLDGRWIAYHSNLSGEWQVYVQPFPALDGRWQVSTQGGVSPIWDPNGHELFYRSGRAVMSVPVETTGTTFRHGNPKLLFEGSYVPDGTEPWDTPSYAVSPDGQRFLMMKEEGRTQSSAGRQIVVIVNWAEELKRLLPPK
jgi:eukaryotic-like serine/threonine-protein kinase